MSLPAVVRVELTPETRRLLLRLIEAVEKLGRSQPPMVHHTFAESPPEPSARLLRRCIRCGDCLASGEEELCANCERIITA